MKKQVFLLSVLLLIVAVTFVSCLSDDDESKDKVEQVTLYVSSETGTYSPIGFDVGLREGILIREKGHSDWICVGFDQITGFTYEKGNEYELLVKKTTLANPPQDARNVEYSLIRIVSQTKK